MTVKKKVLTDDQINDTKELCKLLAEVPNDRRKIYVISTIAYINGMEAGALLQQNGRKKKLDGESLLHLERTKYRREIL